MEHTNEHKSQFFAIFFVQILVSHNFQDNLNFKDCKGANRKKQYEILKAFESSFNSS